MGGYKGEVGVPLWSPMLRGVNYAGCIAFKNLSKKKRYLYQLYQGYDFRAAASKIQVFLSCLYIYSTLLAAFFVALQWLTRSLLPQQVI